MAGEQARDARQPRGGDRRVARRGAPSTPPAGSFDAALDACLRALSLDTGSPRVHLEMTRLYFERGWDRARRSQRAGSSATGCCSSSAAIREVQRAASTRARAAEFTQRADRRTARPLGTPRRVGRTARVTTLGPDARPADRTGQGLPGPADRDPRHRADRAPDLRPVQPHPGHPRGPPRDRRDRPLRRLRRRPVRSACSCCRRSSRPAPWSACSRSSSSSSRSCAAASSESAASARSAGCSRPARAAQSRTRRAAVVAEPPPVWPPSRSARSSSSSARPACRTRPRPACMLDAELSPELLETIFTPHCAAPRRRGDHPRRPRHRGGRDAAAVRDRRVPRALRHAPPRRARHHRADRRARRSWSARRRARSASSSAAGSCATSTRSACAAALVELLEHDELPDARLPSAPRRCANALRARPPSARPPRIVADRPPRKADRAPPPPDGRRPTAPAAPTPRGSTAASRSPSDRGRAE